MNNIENKINNAVNIINNNNEIQYQCFNKILLKPIISRISRKKSNHNKNVSTLPFGIEDDNIPFSRNMNTIISNEKIKKKKNSQQTITTK